MVAVSTSVLGVELVPPKWLLPASVSPGEVPVTSWPSGYSLRSAGRFDSSFFLISLCTGTQNVRVCVCVCVWGFCVCPYRLESPFPIVPWIFHIQAPLASKPVILGACLPSAGPVAWGAQCLALTPCFLGQTSATVITLPFYGWRCGSWLYWSSDPYIHFIVDPS